MEPGRFPSIHIFGRRGFCIKNPSGKAHYMTPGVLDGNHDSLPELVVDAGTVASCHHQARLQQHSFLYAPLLQSLMEGGEVRRCHAQFKGGNYGIPNAPAGQIGQALLAILGIDQTGMEELGRQGVGAQHFLGFLLPGNFPGRLGPLRNGNPILLGQ